MKPLQAALAAGVVLVSGLLMAPYYTGRLVSGNADRDATAYLTVLADACLQARAGVYPPYVGQSEPRFNGGLYPQAQAPALTLVAPALDLLTGRSLGWAALLNLVVVLAGMLAATSMFAVLCCLDRPRPWLAAVLSLAYVACPAVLGVMFRLDMLTSFLVLPVLPWTWRALLLTWSGRAVRGGILLGLSLALAWAVHPPVALWTTCVAAVAGLVGLARTRRGMRAALVAALVFGLAAAWHLTVLATLTGGKAAAVGVGGGTFPQEMAAQAVTWLLADLPGALLPVGAVRGDEHNGWFEPTPEARFLPASWLAGGKLPYLQLGWLLWAGLLLGVVAVFARRVRSEPSGRALQALCAGAALLLVFLFPIYGLTGRLWEVLPQVFSITRYWPQQRLYLVLASLVPVIAVLAWRALPAPRPHAGRWRAGLLVALALWSAREAVKFTAFGFTRRQADFATLAENLALRGKDLQQSAPRRLQEFSDPALHLRLLDEAGHTVADNFEGLRSACEQAPPLSPVPGVPRVARLQLEPGRRVAVCLFTPPGGLLVARGPRLLRSLRTGIWRSPAGVEVLPLFASGPEPQPVELSLSDGLGQPAPFIGARLLPYERERLPLRVTSWLPLRITVDRDDTAGLWLETRRLFVPGYRARVDGRAVPVGPSPIGLLSVGLSGSRPVVEVEYVGTAAMRLTFWVSLAAWVALVAWLVATRERPGP